MGEHARVVRISRTETDQYRPVSKGESVCKADGRLRRKESGGGKKKIKSLKQDLHGDILGEKM